MANWACAACGGENPVGMRFCGHCGAPAGTSVTAETQAPSAEATAADALRSFVADQVAERLIETGGRLPEERRLITALFADVSGFTSLADRLDPEQLLEVIDPVISALSSIVSRYDGYVEKFAGDALLALFGAPVSHEDDAARALLVALEMHRELGRMAEKLPGAGDLTLHVGVNSGHGIARILGSEARMDYAVLGDSVILAQRLESAAPKGETYVSELTVKLTEDGFEFEPVGELTLKGKAEPVPAWRLLGERRRRGAVVDRAAAPAHRLVGRDEELHAVGEIVEGLRRGRGGVVTVVGEPGVGKSRLTEEVRRLGEEHDLRWLETRCVSYGAGLAYWPYSELLRDFADGRPDDAPAEAARRLTSALAAVGVAEAQPFFARLLALPSADGAEEILNLEPEAFRRRLHDAFASWTRALARSQPTVVMIEDVHWADASSLALTAELAALSAQDRVLLYLIGRPEAEPAFAEIAASRHMIRLEPLDEGGVAELIETFLGGNAPAGLAPFIRDRTEGNPFFVEEMLRSLQETDVLARDDGGWMMRGGWDARTLPTTIEEVLAARIDLLPGEAASMLQTASVIGRRVQIPLLAAVLESPRLEEPLAQLVASGFLDRSEEGEEQSVSFHHALVQDVAYSRLLRRRRQELHLLIADVGERLYGAGDDTIDLLARHLYLGGAGAKAVDYLVRAGDRARRLFANEEAILHLTRAVELVRGEPELTERLPELLLDLGELHELVGHYDDGLQVYDEVRATTNDVRAWRGIASIFRKRGEYTEALRVVDEAFAAEELKGRDLLPLWLEQGWTIVASGRYPEAADVLRAGLEVAGARREPLVGHLLVQLARAQIAGGDFQAALTNTVAAEKIFDEAEDVVGLTSTLRVMGGAYLALERLDEAGQSLRRALALAQRVGSAEEIVACLINLGLVELERGALQEAVACDRQAIAESERVGLESGRATAHANLAEKLAHLGEYEEALEMCATAVEIADAIGRSQTLADVAQVRGMIALREGAFADAAAQAEQAAALFLELGESPRAAESLELAAQAWEEAGEKERARETSERALSL